MPTSFCVLWCECAAFEQKWYRGEKPSESNLTAIWGETMLVWKPSKFERDWTHQSGSVTGQAVLDRSKSCSWHAICFATRQFLFCYDHLCCVLSSDFMSSSAMPRPGRQLHVRFGQIASCLFMPNHIVFRKRCWDVLVDIASWRFAPIPSKFACSAYVSAWSLYVLAQGIVLGV